MRSTLFGSRTRLLILATILLIVLYLLGVGVRKHYGIQIAIENLSGHTMQELRVNDEPAGRVHRIGNLLNGQVERVFVQPTMESHITLQFQGVNGVTGVQTIVGYVDSGYCGKAEVNVLAGDRVTSAESIDPVFCRESWAAFF